jgi:hypothetical protein
MSAVGAGAPVKADEGWTERVQRGTTAAPQPAQPRNAVRPEAGPPLGGLASLQADCYRVLGRVYPRPSALPDVLLRKPRGQDAGVWRPRAEGLGRLPLPAGWPGPASGVDAWDLVLGRARRPGLRRYLGPPGEQGPPGGGELSASHPHGPGDVPPARVPACGGRVARVPARRGAGPR